MPSQTIIWTALPNGYGGSGKPRLSVHVGPRLVPDGTSGTLADFPDWTTWPSTTITRYLVQFGSGETVPATAITSPAASAPRWNALFSSSTLVRGRAFEDLTERRIRSYPVGNVIEHLRQSYVNLAVTSGDDFPSRSQLGPLVDPLRPDPLSGALGQVEALNGPPNYAVLPKPPNPSLDFAQLQRFHTPPAVRQPGAGDAPHVPQIDFHQMCSLAQDHPPLLRLLRLVVDLELDEVPTVTGITTVRVLAGGMFSLPATTNVFPLTQCEIGGGVFRAVPTAVNVDVADGYLRLDDASTFGVALVDQDGGGLKAIGLAATVQQAQEHATVDTPDTFALPSLRAQALAVFRTGRAPALRSDRLVRGLSLDKDLTTGVTPGDNVLLFAEDLVQGARVDAQDVSIGVWRSLGARSGKLVFTSTNTTEAVAYDEAPSNAAAASAHDGSSDDLYLGETIVTWNGWSVGAPRPRQFIDNEDQLVARKSQANVNGLPLEISYTAVPGSLPRLRYGASYRLRARTTDLGGNSLPLTDPSAAHASPTQLFGRLEPVQSPAVLLRTARAVGDAVDRLVLRSNYNAAPSPVTAERHVAAPKVAQRTAELHGMFDTAGPPSVVDPNAYGLITGRESKGFPDLGSAQPDPAGGGVYYFDVDAITVPYLPDPVARGALLRGVGGATNEVAVDFDGAWPDLAGVRLVMREPGPNDPPFLYDAPNHRLDVYVAKADRRSIRISAVPDANGVLAFGLWRWITDAGGATAQLQGDVTAGRHWMFTPFRTLTLVHAVKQPLATPEFPTIRPVRNPGETFATLVGSATFSRKSTGRIDLEATWDEYLDDGPGAPAPTRPDPSNPGAWLDRPQRSAIAVSTSVKEEPPFGAPDVFTLAEVPTPGPRHTFGDTKHRDVDYLARAYSRFDDFFRKDGTADFGAANPVLLDAAGVVAGSVRLTSTVGTVDGPRTVSYVEGTDFTVDPPSGNVTRAQGSTMPNQVDASWVPRPNDRAASSRVRVRIPTSARPDAPKLLYVVPTFAWSSTSEGKSIVRARSGSSLRVYLDRPWWSSGGGELLGVVTANGASGQSPLPPDAALVATQWGVDPVHAGAATPDAPDPVAFPLRVAANYSLGVPEAPGVSLAAAGHEVGFDDTRGLWYCDLVVDTGATYMPFVRLALARFQPDALGGLELSPVVLADFAQLAADRTVSVTQPKAGVYLVQLTGPTYQTPTTTDAAGPLATVTVQQRRPGVTGPLAWQSLGKVKLARQVLAGPTVAFTGTVTVSAATRAAGARLLFEEFEQVRVDGGALSSPEYGRRPVYADALELS